MTTLLNLVRSEPVRLVAAIQATVALVAAFGFELTAEQVAAIPVTTAAWLAFVTRQKVEVSAPETPAAEDA